MSQPNMKRVELKRIVEFLWKGSPAGEKTPFASEGVLPDNGSFSKNLESDDHEKAGKEFPGDENVEGPMSTCRKFWFAMSFNLWILYFLVLGWLLPCKHHECGPYFDTVERSLPNIRPLTDMEPMNTKGLPPLVMLGYTEERELKLAAFATFDATFEWNNTLPFVPEKIQCRFGNSFDADEDGTQDCLLSGFADVYAFNASNGYVFWHRHLPSEEGDILSGFHPTSVFNNASYLIGTYGSKMVVLGATSGNKTVEMDLPCSSPIGARLLPGRSNVTAWVLVCDKGDSVEAWSFDERDVLRGENLEDDSSAFSLLFRSESSGSIDLRRDVTALPGGPLLFSLDDRVAIVTGEDADPVPLSLTSIAAGNFTATENGAAVAWSNGTDTVVSLMRLKDRVLFKSVTLANRQAQLMETVPGNHDLVLLTSVIVNNSTEESGFLSDPVPRVTNFVLIDFHAKQTEVKEVANETLVLRSSVSIETNGDTDLLILKRANGTTTYVRHLIKSDKSICHSFLKYPKPL